MNKYTKGKIYALKSKDCDKFYIGSTCTSLAKRLDKHRRHYKEYLNGKGKYISSYEVVKQDDCEIELIEKYPCTCKGELFQQEGLHIRARLGDLYNVYIAGNSGNWKEYKQRHFAKQGNYQKHLERCKRYRENNREKVKESQKKYDEKTKAQKSEYGKQYYQKHKELISKKGAEKVQCECGSNVRQDHITRHKRSKKHLKFIGDI